MNTTTAPSDLHIRIASESDAENILKIYAPYVEQTAITFEYEVPSLEEFTERIQETLKRYPYLVAVKDGTIVGYAYVSSLKNRAAYDWAVETSIYVDMARKQEGIGKKLYAVLEQILRELGILNLYACIAYPETEDEYLTKDSIEFHAHLGYRLIGEFRNCGYKFDRWYHMVWMEKMIGEHHTGQADPQTFSSVRNSVKIRQILTI